MSATILSGFYDIDMLYKVILHFKLRFLYDEYVCKTLLRPSSRALDALLASLHLV